ncbi:MAG: ribonuclease III [Pirellulales bacterium]
MSSQPTAAMPAALVDRDPEALARGIMERIGYEFQDPSILLSALTHASGAQHRLASNERLEFLGDAILGAIVCETLYKNFPEYLEGDLTKIKSVVVSRQTLAKLSTESGLQDFLILGKGMTTHAEVPASLMADVFESLVAALYLDGGHEAARRFVMDRIGPEIEEAVSGENSMNYKSTLQQYAQREFGQTPNYLLLDEKGPDHSKIFKIAAQIGKTRYTPAWGKNKKEAEQRAARNALCEMRGEPAPFLVEESDAAPLLDG